MKIKKEQLLLLAGVIWLLAGGKVLQIGLMLYIPYTQIGSISASVLVFCLFHYFVFSRLVRKHTKRIVAYPDPAQSVLRVFDRRSYVIMVGMMSLGFMVRHFEWASDHMIAIFYSGLGSALVVSGVLFIYQYATVWQERE
ncbi:MAG: hypothetical protein ACRDBX_07455 [Erysipelotrichaceae bacterium]